MRNKSHQPRGKNEFEIKDYFLEKKNQGAKKEKFRYYALSLLIGGLSLTEGNGIGQISFFLLSQSL